VLEMLDPGRSRRPVNPLFQGAYAFERVENARLAWYARDFLAGARRPAPDGIAPPLQKDLELIGLRLLECREPRELDVWLNSALHVAKMLNPFLAPDDAGAVWLRIARSPCFGELRDFQRRWLMLFRAVGARDAPRMAEFGAQLLGSEMSVGSEAREYLLMAAMTGYLAERRPAQALELWHSYSEKIPRAAAAPAFRLLRCHADPGSCTAAFRDYAEH
jgi:hypothetical protein